MQEANETVGTADQLVPFGKAIEALKQGKRITKNTWSDRNMFLFLQVPSAVNCDIVPKMTSLPQSVKDEFERRRFLENPIRGIEYHNQIAFVGPDNSIQGWAANSWDILEEDWIILD